MSAIQLAPTLTFETKCWENDWEFILKGERLATMIRHNQHDFAKRVLYINNVKNISQVSFAAQKLVDEGVLTNYYVVEEYAEEVLGFYGLTRADFKGGYYYSIAELTGIYLCETEYLLHFAGDSMAKQPINWLDTALAEFSANPAVKVANLCWNERYWEAEKESCAESGDFWLGYGFSDQCYLIRSADFKAQIYAERHPDSERYPAYGGELFEKRVDSWMRNNEFKRLTYKHGSYIHKNFPKHPLLRKLALLFK